ncbi:MAG: hypothetical protein IKH76_01985 [Clostridiales bacterium]|nr:hypothetical protein [Clostridiales bacterium]
MAGVRITRITGTAEKKHSSGDHKGHSSSNNKKKPSGDEQKKSSHVTGQVKTVSGTTVTLVKGTLKKTASSESSSDKVYEFTPDSSGEETTLDLSQVKDLNTADITEGKVLVITLDKDGKPSKVKVRTPGDEVTQPKTAAATT